MVKCIHALFYLCEVDELNRDYPGLLGVYAMSNPCKLVKRQASQARQSDIDVMGVLAHTYVSCSHATDCDNWSC